MLSKYISRKIDVQNYDLNSSQPSACVSKHFQTNQTEYRRKLHYMRPAYIWFHCEYSNYKNSKIVVRSAMALKQNRQIQRVKLFFDSCHNNTMNREQKRTWKGVQEIENEANGDQTRKPNHNPSWINPQKFYLMYCIVQRTTWNPIWFSNVRVYLCMSVCVCVRYVHFSIGI